MMWQMHHFLIWCLCQRLTGAVASALLTSVTKAGKGFGFLSFLGRGAEERGKSGFPSGDAADYSVSSLLTWRFDGIGVTAGVCVFPFDKDAIAAGFGMSHNFFSSSEFQEDPTGLVPSTSERPRPWCSCDKFSPSGFTQGTVSFARACRPVHLLPW